MSSHPDNLRGPYIGQTVPIHEHSPNCSNDIGTITEIDTLDGVKIRCTRCLLPVFINRGPVRHFPKRTHS